MVVLIHVAFQRAWMILNLIKMLLDHVTQIHVKTAENALMMDTIINVNAKSVSMVQNVKMFRPPAPIIHAKMVANV